MQLTQADVERLTRTASPLVRGEVAAKIARDFSQGRLGGREKDIAVEIFRLLVRDAEWRVRKTLSHHLNTSSDLPRDVALSLANDVAQVAVPMLEFSAILDDEDLIAIIDSSREAAKWQAIARRELVSAPVCDALVHTDAEDVAQTLIENAGAQILDASLLHVVETMAENESIVEALMERGNLPVVCVERIFMKVSDAMRRRLIEEYQVSRHLVEGRFEYAHEMNTLGLAGRSDDVNVEALVRHMRKQRKLTSSIVLRALCVGDLRFFEHAMAELTDIPVVNVRRLMLDAGEQGFLSLYRLSPLPPAYYAAVKCLLELVLAETHNGREHPQDFNRLMVEKIVAKGYDSTVEYMPLLLAIIKGNASEPSRIH
jgi:uncharacterized protein (DUF2336 family)